MERIIALFFLICLLLLSMTGCALVPATTYTEHNADYEYSVGESIKVLDIESKQVLGSVTITDVIIIKDEPFEISEIADYNDNSEPVYETETYAAIVQVNYIYDTIDSSKKITTRNFSVTDALGNSVEFYPDTEYTKSITGDNNFVVAVKEKGEFINIDFAFHTNQEDIAYIKAYYDDSVVKNESEDASGHQVESNSDEKIKNDDASNKLLTIICIMQGFAIIVLIVILIFVLCRKNMNEQN